MNLQQLNHLVALAETRSFSRASEAVHVTQSALSRSIQTLEQELGSALIDRIGKQNELTSFGVLVLAQAKEIITRTEELKRSANLMAQGTVGVVNMGISSALSALFAQPLISHVLHHYPDVRLRLYGGSNDAQLQLLRARELDAALLAYTAVPPGGDFEVAPLPPLRSGFICRAGHPLLQRKRVTFDDARAFPLVSTRVSDDTARILIERFGERASPRHWIQASSEDVSALLRSVASSNALFLGVVAVAHQQIREGLLCELEILKDPRVQARFAFVSLRGRAPAPALSMIRETCESLVVNEYTSADTP